MTNQEAIKVIKNNWPDERYTMLREALTLAIDELDKTSYSTSRAVEQPQIVESADICDYCNRSKCPNGGSDKFDYGNCCEYDRFSGRKMAEVKE